MKVMPHWDVFCKLEELGVKGEKFYPNCYELSGVSLKRLIYPICELSRIPIGTVYFTYFYKKRVKDSKDI